MNPREENTNRRGLVPGMFHRRVLVLGGSAAAVVVAMVFQLVRLTVVEAAEHRTAAEMRLDGRTILPTYRGRILDRWGLVLAEDRAGYDLAVRYDVITGSWELSQAMRDARRAAGSEKWSEMTDEQRDRATRAYLEKWQDRAAALWSRISILGQIDEEELTLRRDEIRADVHRMAAYLKERQRQARIKSLGLPEDEDIRPEPIAEETGHHVVLTDISDDVAFAFRRFGQDFGQLIQVVDAQQRVYPWKEQRITVDRSTLPKPIRSEQPVVVQVSGVLDHVLGSMRSQTTSRDLERRPFWKDGQSGGEIADLGGYQLIGDHVGAQGIELVYEDHLRGLRGVERRRKDTGEVERTDPVPGTDIHLTVDINLQAQIQALLSPEAGLTRVQHWHRNDERLPAGTSLNSAAAVLDIESGEILALVSIPTVQMGAAMSDLQRDVTSPFVNRALEGVYPPGSILKPLVLCAAVGSGAHGIDVPVRCDGHYYPHVTSYARCWIYRQEHDFMTHGELRAAEALARSCNIYFYTLADETGMSALSQWMRGFGLGAPLDIGLLHAAPWDETGRIMIGEQDGDLPDADDIARWAVEYELQGHEIAMGIGQGPVTWTPLHAAQSYGVLARGGAWRQPTIVIDDPRAGRHPQREPLDLHPAAVRESLKGLRMSVTEQFGSGNHLTYGEGPSLEQELIFTIKGVTVWGKTGTAQAPALPFDGNRNGRIDRDERGVPLEHDRLSGLSHAWFVGLVGPEGSEQPTHAISVIVEYGGSGGRVAGPIANQIIRLLQEEGYLPSGS